MSFYNTIKRANEFGIPVNEAIDMRMKFIHKELIEDYLMLGKQNTPINKLFAERIIERKNKELKYLLKYSQISKDDPNRVTSDRIEQAKDIPIESIIEFDRAGKAPAFCHNDKHPSLSKHPTKNFARCFVCNNTFNTVDAYMGLYDVTFVQAVKALT